VHATPQKERLSAEAVQKTDIHREGGMSEFQEKSKGYPLSLVFKTTLFFFEKEDGIFKALFIHNINIIHPKVSKNIFFIF
jgi:hypothetical protein